MSWEKGNSPGCRIPRDLDRYQRRQNSPIFGKKGKENLEFLEEDALHALLTTHCTQRELP